MIICDACKETAIVFGYWTNHIQNGPWAFCNNHSPYNFIDKKERLPSLVKFCSENEYIIYQIIES
jgi:hypothetical protein